MPRPRTITDEQLLDATGRTIKRLGPNFTLADVAKEAGVSVGTFAQRFGSKHGLLLALFTPGTEQTVLAVRTAAAKHADPVEALRAGAVAAFADLDDPETAANDLAQLASDLADPALRAALDKHFSTVQAELTALAAAAELPGAPEPEAAGRILHALGNGTAIQWSVRPSGGLITLLRKDIGAVIDAWR